MPSEDSSLLGRLEGALGPRYTGFIVVVAVALLLLLALAVEAQGANALRAGIWPLGLSATITVYILLVHPFMRRRWQRAIQSLLALTPHGAGVAPHKPISQRAEWGAMLVGAVVGLVVARDTPDVDGWVRLYAEATSALMFALLAGAIYASLSRARHLAAHLRGALELNVFDGHLLTPFAQWGQSLSLVFVGGISVSLLFQSYDSLRSVEGMVVYGTLVIVALTLFFLSMWSIHVALVHAQQAELVRIRRDLAVARAALRRDRAQDAAGPVEDAYLPAVVCGMYEKQVLEASTWPFNPTIVGRLFASTIAPLGVYVLKLAFGVGGGL